LVALAVVILGLSITNPETVDSAVSSFTMALVILGLQTGGYWAIAHN